MAVVEADGTPAAPAAPLGDNYLITAHEDGLIRRWDSRKASMAMAEWGGEGAPVTSLAARGDKLVSGTSEGTVRLWDAQTGLSLRCDGHTGQIAGIAAGGDYFCTASWDGTLRTWAPVCA